MATLDELNTARTAAAQKLTAEAQGVANLMAQLNTAQAAYARAKAEGAKADQAYADALREMLAAIEPAPAKHGWHIPWPSARLTAVLGWVAAAIMAVVLLAGSGLHLPHIPVPTPAPAPPQPVPAGNFRAMIVYDSSKLASLPRGQLNVLYDQSVRSYLDQKTIMGPDGKTHEYRIWDRTVDPSGDAQEWQDMFKQVGTTLPWLVLQNDRARFSGPLPVDVASTIALLKKYGG